MNQRGLQGSISALLIGLSACSARPPVSQSSAPIAVMTPSPAPPPVTRPSPAPTEPTAYDLALDKAASARSISSSAQSQDDWLLVAAQLEEAIALLKTIPTSNPKAKQARAKLREYQNQLATANRRAGGPFKSAAVPSSRIDNTPQTLAASQPKSLRVPILYRLGNTPVIGVTFNGNQTYDMILDTGATATVITPQMAKALSVTPVSQTTVNTASQKGLVVPIGIAKSIAVGSLVVQNLPVAIAGPELEIGLLGHNFFDGYDLIIRRNYIEFQAQ